MLDNSTVSSNDTLIAEVEVFEMVMFSPPLNVTVSLSVPPVSTIVPVVAEPPADKS